MARFRPHCATRAVQPRCSTEDSEEDRAQRRAQNERDGAARQGEQRGGSGLVDEDLGMLRERLELMKTRETQLDEIKLMLRMMEPATGLQFVTAEGGITATAWIFVVANIVVALYLTKATLVDPFTRVLTGNLPS